MRLILIRKHRVFLALGSFFFCSVFLFCEEGRLYLRNGNIFDGDISFNSSGQVEIKILNGRSCFAPSAIEKIIFKEEPSSPGREFLKVLNQNQEELLSQRVSEYDRLIHAVAREKGLDPLLVKAVIKMESNFHPFAVSSKGACGLMQLMPETAALLGVKDVFNPSDNLKGGMEYLRQMMARFEGNLVLALAAYNAGPLAIEKYQGIPPYAETRGYVRSVLDHFRKLQSSGTDVALSQDEEGNLYFNATGRKEVRKLLSESR